MILAQNSRDTAPLHLMRWSWRTGGAECEHVMQNANLRSHPPSKKMPDRRLPKC